MEPRRPELILAVEVRGGQQEPVDCRALCRECRSMAPSDGLGTGLSQVKSFFSVELLHAELDPRACVLLSVAWSDDSLYSNKALGTPQQGETEVVENCLTCLNPFNLDTASWETQPDLLMF